MKRRIQYKAYSFIVFILVFSILSSAAAPILAGSRFEVGDKASPSKFNTAASHFEPDSGMLLANLTDGTAYGGSQISKEFYSGDIKKLAFIAGLLHSGRLDEVVTAQQDAKLLELIPGMEPGGFIQISELLKQYLYSSSTDIQTVILETLRMDFADIAAKADAVFQNGWLYRTAFTEEVFLQKAAPTCAYDLYSIMHELLSFPWFREHFGKSETAVAWYDAFGKKRAFTVSDSGYASAAEGVPENFTFRGHITTDQSYGSSQILIAADQDNQAYISIVIGEKLRNRLNAASKKVLATLNGEAFLTMQEEEMLKNPTPTAKPVPTAPLKPTEKPAPTVPLAEQPEEAAVAKDKHEKEGLWAVTSGYSTPTSSSSSVAIPKVNDNLESYGPITLPAGSDEERYAYLLGTVKKDYTFDMPPKGYYSEAEAAKHMITITVPVWKMTEQGVKFTSQYDVTVHQKLAASVKAIFQDIYSLPEKFPIKILKGYAYREVGGVGLNNVTLMSMHAYGAALDINPGDFDNDYYLGAGNDLRDLSNPYCIPDAVIKIFEEHGWFWGGNFPICADTMHFQYLGLDYLSYQGNNPFRELVAGGALIKGSDVWNLQMRLKELGYRITVDGVYGKESESVIKKFQKKYGLEAAGIVDYQTWEKLVNLTHYLPYAF